MTTNTAYHRAVAPSFLAAESLPSQRAPLVEVFCDTVRTTVRRIGRDFHARVDISDIVRLGREIHPAFPEIFAADLSAINAVELINAVSYECLLPRGRLFMVHGFVSLGVIDATVNQSTIKEVPHLSRRVVCGEIQFREKASDDQFGVNFGAFAGVDVQGAHADALHFLEVALPTVQRVPARDEAARGIQSLGRLLFELLHRHGISVSEYAKTSGVERLRSEEISRAQDEQVLAASVFPKRPSSVPGVSKALVAPGGELQVLFSDPAAQRLMRADLFMYAYSGQLRGIVRELEMWLGTEKPHRALIAVVDFLLNQTIRSALVGSNQGDAAEDRAVPLVGRWIMSSLGKLLPGGNPAVGFANYLGSRQPEESARHMLEILRSLKNVDLIPNEDREAILSREPS